ncbi:MAG: peptidase and in kexin sedolisin [Gemmatimonadetes bacterium]|nr:peptidase and in kexin sedolisin [Gemmatimonadota bacterium]
MRKVVLPALLCGLAACSDVPSSPQVATPFVPSSVSRSNANVPIPGQYIVQFRPSGVASLANARYVESRVGGVTKFVYTTVLNGAAMTLADDAAAALRLDPRILSVDQDHVVSINTTQNNPPSWGLDRVDQRNLPLSSSYTYTPTGAGVTAYILDTGLNFAQTDFGGRASAGIDEITPGGGSVDCNGHGTHTAGTVGSATYGVAKGVNVVAVRVLDCTGSGSYAAVIAGIDWVTAHAVKPAVASMSLGGPFFQPLNDAVTNSMNAGIPYAIAAGNAGTPACNDSPGSTPGAITVGATNITDGFASFSNSGACVALNAPGVNIKSLWIGANGATSTISGTSMATPHVAGVIAQYLQLNPSAPPAQVRSALIANATPAVLSGVPAGTPNLLLYNGFLGGTPNQAPVARFTISCPTLRCTADGSSSTDDVAIVSYRWNWGDGRSETHVGPTANNTWAAPGTYNITLTVTDGGGLTNSTSKMVTIPTPAANQPPTATITAPANNASFPQGTSVSFAGTGQDPEDGALTGGSLVWTSSINGQIGTGTSFSTSSLSVGTHTITLTAKDAQNATGTATRTITITPAANQPPVANFTFTCSATVAHQCSFDGSASTDDHGVTNYAWNWGDGRAESHVSATATNTWASAGTYSITLTVTDAGGLTNSITKQVAVP